MIEEHGQQVTPDGGQVRLIALHLPQFHPIPENDRWWGKGFTEWTNVARAKPFFPGHDQPRVPADLGYYDLRLAEARDAQATLAMDHGIAGFCYWHYWFNGKVLLEQPIEGLLEAQAPDFPFCLAWANEHWTRRWDGHETDILQPQDYGGEEDDRRHFEWLLRFFSDSRYLTVGGKPVLLVYRPGGLPDAKATVALWRMLALEAGLPGLYLIGIRTSFSEGNQTWKGMGFDADLFFQPHFSRLYGYVEKRIAAGDQELVELNGHSDGHPGLILPYGRACRLMAWESLRSTTDLACVVPRWDNTARRGKRAFVLKDASPEDFGAWLATEMVRVSGRPPEERLVFVNAWNEWAEGNYLEPDCGTGLAFLEAIKANESPELRSESSRRFLESLAEVLSEIGEHDEAAQARAWHKARSGLKVSIVVPVFNKVDLTRNCLDSIAANTDGVEFEVVVVDNGSGDGTAEYLATLTDPRIKPMRLEVNLGFVGACNLGAAASTGDYLLFLNNDTLVHRNWLSSLVELAEALPDCGAVGSKLVYPDGRLQEAGGIIFSDGNGCNYGREGNPAEPHFNSVREVDYCSGASLLIRKSLWDEIGGFDTRFAPAYYEDTDLCFAVRAKGFKVYYQPRSVVVHLEGQTAGTDTSKGYKRFQIVNREKFLDKWQAALSQQYPNDHRLISLAADRRTHGGREHELLTPYELPDPRQFNCAAFPADSGEASAITRAYCTAIGESDLAKQVSLTFFAGPNARAVFEAVDGSIGTYWQGGDRPDIHIVDRPFHADARLKYMFSADLVLGPEDVCKSARDAGLPAFSSIDPAHLKVACESFRLLDWSAEPLEVDCGGERWLCARADHWESALTFFLGSIDAGPPKSLIVRVPSGMADFYADAIGEWLTARGIDPESGPDISLMDGPLPSEIPIFKASAVLIDTGDPAHEAMAAALGLRRHRPVMPCGRLS